MKVQHLFEAKTKTPRKSLMDVDVETLKSGGDFSCENLDLTSLAGAPSSIDGDFNCIRNYLTSLMGAPSSVKGNFDCSINEIKSLAGAPTFVGGKFKCNYNKLTSLQGAPSKIDGEFDCQRNQLASLHGAPSSVKGDFWCDKNRLTSLEGSPSFVGGDYICDTNKLTSLKDIHKQIKHIGGALYAYSNPIKSHLLGVLLIDGLQRIETGNWDADDIVNAYLPNDEGMAAVFNCQEDLIEAGLEGFAQL